MEIGTNPIAQKAVLALHSANAAMVTSMERISTGYRINRASDDPVGMIQGNRLKTQIGSMSKAIDNVNQGVAMTQVVDGALSEVVKVLNDMYGQALMASSLQEPPALPADSPARTSYQSQMAAHLSSIQDYANQIDRISDTARWGNTALMGTSKTIQFGPGGSGLNQKMTITFDPVSKTALSVNAIAMTDSAGATAAMETISQALEKVYKAQSKSGAAANVLTAQGDAMTSMSTALSSAYGNIMNADLARETANLAMAQIRRDGATAMLTQANAMNRESVAYLLRSVAL